MVKKGITIFFVLMMICAVAMVPLGCQNSILDPSNPTTVTVWHYYNGAQQAAFSKLVDEFNQTEGKEKGVYVEATSKGNVNDLEREVLAAFNKEVGSSEPPDIFSSYADTAYAIEQMDVLVNLEDYLTEEELGTYVDSFISEGRIGNDGELRIFPTAKSSEIFMMNKTDWDEFAKAENVTTDMLKTMEGVASVAEKYYNWTDAKTPDIPDDGKAFYGRDAMANLFIIGSMQLGVELFKVDKGQVTLQIDKTIMKKIWDTYYVPFVKGYFKAVGRFRSDDVATGDIIAYTGATTSASYFPSAVENPEGRRNIEYAILPVPIFEGGADYVIQQGAGMVVTKTDEKREYASILFLKWFTSKENNLLFGSSSGYMPVKKEAFDLGALDKVIEDNQTTINPKTYDTIKECFETFGDAKLYTNKAFNKGADARKILEYNLSDKAAADRAAVVKEMSENGTSMAEAVAPYITEAEFDKWFNGFENALRNSVK